VPFLEISWLHNKYSEVLFLVNGVLLVNFGRHSHMGLPYDLSTQAHDMIQMQNLCLKNKYTLRWKKNNIEPLKKRKMDNLWLPSPINKSGSISEVL
jgi:hypothetical protein